MKQVMPQKMEGENICIFKVLWCHGEKWERIDNQILSTNFQCSIFTDVELTTQENFLTQSTVYTYISIHNWEYSNPKFKNWFKYDVTQHSLPKKKITFKIKYWFHRLRGLTCIVVQPAEFKIFFEFWILGVSY